ncbi:MAG: metallophosphoesterase [Planctomycetota bacterium]
MLRFLHTADWQLGITRRYLGADAQARYAQARLDVIVRMGDLAQARGCAFMVVAGDVFDSNLVDRQTLLRALDALARVAVPVLILPGNHDAHDPSSIYRAASFLEHRPRHVHLLVGDAATFTGLPDVEVVGVPWTTRKPAHDLVAASLSKLAPPRCLRVVVAHGRTDAFRPARREAASIGQAAVEQALQRRLLHYLALGDRHSFGAVGDSGRVFYAGTPEPTDFDEERPGHAALVEFSSRDAPPRVEAVPVGTWRFLRLEAEVGDGGDVDQLARALATLPNKERTVVRLDLRGSLDADGWLQLERHLDAQRDVFAALDRRDGGLTLAADALTSAAESHLDTRFGLAGWPAEAARALMARAPREGAARDALLLLHRLTHDAGPQ